MFLIIVVGELLQFLKPISEDRLYSATNYIAHLSEPLKNVVNIEVKSVEIPKVGMFF